MSIEVEYVDRRVVLIDAGTVTESNDLDLIGERRFFVVFIDEDGGCMTIWDGAHHSDARRAAWAWAGDFGIPVVDRAGPIQ